MQALFLLLQRRGRTEAWGGTFLPKGTTGPRQGAQVGHWTYDNRKIQQISQLALFNIFFNYFFESEFEKC
jgi:hypothetical protein